jgi:hypothetical protein
MTIVEWIPSHTFRLVKRLPTKDAGAVFVMQQDTTATFGTVLQQEWFTSFGPMLREWRDVPIVEET